MAWRLCRAKSTSVGYFQCSQCSRGLSHTQKPSQAWWHQSRVAGAEAELLHLRHPACTSQHYGLAWTPKYCTFRPLPQKPPFPFSPNYHSITQCTPWAIQGQQAEVSIHMSLGEDTEHLFPKPVMMSGSLRAPIDLVPNLGWPPSLPSSSYQPVRAPLPKGSKYIHLFSQHHHLCTTRTRHQLPP